MLKRARLLALLALAPILAGCPSSGGDDNSADIWAVNDNNVLVKFDLNETNEIDSSVSITGLQGGETIVGLDFRPATNTLYALGSTSRLYTINASTGAATQVGAAFDVALSGTAFGFDFNPVVDRIRIVSNSEQNMRVNADTGVVVDTDLITPGTQIDTDLSPSGNVVAAAYTNNFAAATLTTLFGIDSSTDNLVMIGGVDGTPSPNGGIITVVGGLGADVGANAAFDINSSGTAVLVDNSGVGANDVYMVSTLTGQATLVGTVGTGGDITAMTIRN